MKICAAQAMMALIVCGVSAAHDNYAQVLDTKITLSLKEVPFELALKKIESASRVKIFYSIDQLGINETVSIEAKDETVRDVLDDLLSPYNIKYKVNERKRAVILKKQTDTGASEEANLNESREFQAGTITGIVLDAISHQPMAGVNIIVKGTSIGTTTDSDGRYSIEARDTDILVFSFIGFAAFETRVNGRNEIDVTMQEGTTSLKEVVVNAGYWDVKQKEQTGNISRITSKEIQQQTVGNPLAAMIGRMPGVYIQQTTGIPGGGFVIRIRGQNSLRNTSADNGNHPLYIVDGVPLPSTSLAKGTFSSPINDGNPLSSINPFDIESIEVLKDADATSIYGSRGANGVILITTKKGKAGKTRFDMNVYTGAGEVSRTMDLLNTRQYLDMRYEAFRNDSVTLSPSTQNANDLTRWDTTRYTDWQEELIGGTANIINAQTSISGGNSQTQFLIGGGYYKETTVFPGDFGYYKGSGHLNLNHSSADSKMNASFSLSYVAENNNLVRQDLTSTALTLPPNAPSIFNDEQELNWENSTWSNPFASLLSKYLNKTDHFIASGRIGYSVFDGFEIKTNVGYNYLTTNQTATLPIKANDPATGITTGTSVFSNGFNKTWILEPQAQYERKIGNGSLNALIGTTFQQSVREVSTLLASGFISDALLEDIKSASGISISSSNYSLYRYNAVFGRLHYNLLGKYLVNLTGRRDGSSRFGAGNRFANFGAVGAAWLFAEEAFIKNSILFLSTGKLRGSYGSTGSDQISDYGYLDTNISSQFPYDLSIGLVPTRLANPEYAWETNKKIESGLELGFLQDRIFVSAAWFRNRSSNQLVGFPLPGTTGFNSIQFNLPATVENTGWEFELSAKPINTSDLQWSLGFNLTVPDNRLIHYPNIEGSPYATVYSVGKPLSIAYSYQYTGVDQASGLYSFEDVDGDGSLSSITDRQFIKSVSQKFFGGFQNSIAYNNFSLDVFFQFTKQTGRNYLYGIFSVPGLFGNQPTEVLNRWQEAGDITDVQRFAASGAGLNSFKNSKSYGDNTISDASFIRLKNVSLSWKFPKSFTERARLENARLYIQGQNLFTITNYLGLDPENQNTSSLPALRMVTAGFQITL